MEPENATLTANAFSGRVNPNFRDNVMAFMLNPFIKLAGLELFGTLERIDDQARQRNAAPFRRAIHGISKIDLRPTT